MKNQFDFPLFSDLVLGPFGDVHGCGCLMAKEAEVEDAAGMTPEEREQFVGHVIEAAGGEKFYADITYSYADNTPGNRRRAYNALVAATEKMGYTIT